MTEKRIATMQRDEVLNDKQKEMAFLFYQKHKYRIDKLVLNAEKSYPPSGGDRQNPMIWKWEHWKWFLANYHQ